MLNTREPSFEWLKTSVVVEQLYFSQHIRKKNIGQNVGENSEKLFYMLNVSVA